MTKKIRHNLAQSCPYCTAGPHYSCGHVQAAAPQQEAQGRATVPRFNCWSTNEGDSWFDHPADAQAIYDCLGNDAKVGDEYELTAGWKSVTARYRITEVVGDGEEYEVECISHPQGNTAPQPAPAELERLRERIARMGLDVDRAMRGHVNEQSPLGTQRLAAIAALVKPKPAPLSDDDAKDAARWRWLRENWFTMTSSYQRRITFKVGGPRWSDITEEELDAAIDAARKQGASHD